MLSAFLIEEPGRERQAARPRQLRQGSRRHRCLFQAGRAEYEISEEIAPGVVLDYDTQGRVIGVEFQNVRKLLAEGSLPDAAAPMADKPAA
jgi:hypothetical protein